MGASAQRVRGPAAHVAHRRRKQPIGTQQLDDAREDLKRCKQRLSKFLMRHGYVFNEATPTGRRKGNWTAAHWAWIRSIEFPEKADNDVLAYYVDAVRQAMEDKKRLEKLVEAEASVSATVKTTNFAIAH